MYRPFRTRTEESLVADAKQQSHFMESIRAIQSIKVFQQENERHSRWQNHYADTINTGIRIGHWNIGYTSLNQLLFGVENVIIIYLAANAVIGSVISLGMLYGFMSYKQRFISSMDSFITQAIEFKMLGLHLERLSDIVLAKTEEDVESGFVADENEAQLRGSLRVENASYRYSEATEPVFSQLNIDIKAGESIALVGPSGCGKTTLVKCLMGLLPLDEGLTIVCNCHSIKQRVVIFILAMDNAAISSGSCSGFNVGKCRLTGFWNALLMPVRGVALISPTLTAYSIISFNRWHRRLTVSRLPFVAMGLIASMAFIAVTLWIGWLPKVGKICFSSERHESCA